jgi:SAM-dependent methyltransferase
MINQNSAYPSKSGLFSAPSQGQSERWSLNLPRNFRYLAVAATCAVVNNFLLIELVKVGVNYFVAIWLAYVPMVLLGYALHATITFRIDASSRTLLRYAMAMLANYPLWIASLFVLYHVMTLPITVAAPLGTVVAFIGNYLAAHWAIMNSISAAFSETWKQNMEPVDQDILSQFVSEYAFQPATALWRTIELPALARLGIPTGRGLDLGSGDGKLTAIFLRLIGNRDLVGVDPDPSEGAEAERRQIYTKVHVCGGDQVPEPDASFDFAISNSVLEHIPNLDPVLAETARLVRPNGMFLITVPHIGFRTQLRGPLVPGVSRADYEARLDKRLAHLRYPSAAEWQAMLDRHGFSTEAIEFYLDRSQVRRWETLSRFTAGVLSTLSGGLLHPIILQRRLGLRQIQNQNIFPAAMARTLARMISFKLQSPPADLDEENTGCVAIRCRRRAPLDCK